jgi:adenosine deaminase
MHTSLVGEYMATARAYGWRTSELHEVARTSIEASFCEPDLRRRLLTALESPSA